MVTCSTSQVQNSHSNPHHSREAVECKGSIRECPCTRRACSSTGRRNFRQIGEMRRECRPGHEESPVQAPWSPEGWSGHGVRSGSPRGSRRPTSHNGSRGRQPKQAFPRSLLLPQAAWSVGQLRETCSSPRVCVLKPYEFQVYRALSDSSTLKYILKKFVLSFIYKVVLSCMALNFTIQ